MLPLQVFATNYYISNSGNDNNAGTTPPKAWQTINKLNKASLAPGDSILFLGGDTFAGYIYVSPYESGTPQNPIVFSAYGTGRAAINAKNGDAMYIYNAGGIEIQNLNIYGSGSGTNTGVGIYFYTDTSNGYKFQHIRINNVLAHGFGNNGIIIGSYNSSYPGYEDVKITYDTINDNGSGLFLYDIAGEYDTQYGHKNVYIGYCAALRNNVNGITVSGVDTGVVEYCRASYTGINSSKGDVGIWAYSSNNVTIQHCISDHCYQPGSGDGEGFDLDGGSQNCVVQYCYSFQNSSNGFMHCDYPSSRPTRRNMIRYNISENDGRKAQDYKCSFEFISWGGGIDSCYIYNNTAYISDTKNIESTLNGYLLFGYGSPQINHCKAINNIFFINGTNKNTFAYLTGGNHPIQDTNVLLIGNCYYATSANSRRWIRGNSPFSTLTILQDSTGQEMLSGGRTGYSTISPSLNNPGKGGTVTDPDSLEYISAYRLKSASFFIGKGLNTDNLVPFPNCNFDFYGDTLYPFHQHSTGADEPQPQHVPIADFNGQNNCLGDSSYFLDSSKYAVKYFWDFGDSSYDSIADPVHKYLHAGNYPVTEVVTSKYGDNDTTIKTIEIYSLPVAKFYAPSVCLGNAVNIMDSSTNAVKYSWFFGDGFTDSVFDPVHLYKKAGTYTISLSVLSVNGCTDTSSRIEQVFALPKAKFSVKNVCLGDSVHFIDSSINAVKYAWNFGDGIRDDAPNPVNVYKTAGSYNVKLTALSANGCADSVADSVHVYPLPDADWSVKIEGSNYTFTADDSTLAAYHWNFNDSQMVAFTFRTVQTFDSSGKYTIALTVKNKNGCSAQKDSSISLTLTGISSGSHLRGNDLKINPNPFIGQTTVNYNITNLSNVSLSLVDVEGRETLLVQTNNQSAGQYQYILDGEKYHLKAGVYFIKAVVNDEVIIVKAVKAE